MNPAVPRRLGAIIAKSTEKDRSRRYQCVCGGAAHGLGKCLPEAITIIRKHPASRDTLDAVAMAIRDSMCWNDTVMCTPPGDLATAAVAAMMGEV